MVVAGQQRRRASSTILILHPGSEHFATNIPIEAPQSLILNIVVAISLPRPRTDTFHVSPSWITHVCSMNRNQTGP